MLGLELTDVPYIYAAAAAALLVISAAVVYVVEIRRAGGTPWTEWYTDRVVPLFRGRRLRRVHGRDETRPERQKAA